MARPGSSKPAHSNPDLRTRLLSSDLHDSAYDHGTFTPSSVGSPPLRPIHSPPFRPIDSPLNRPSSPACDSMRSGLSGRKGTWPQRTAATIGEAEEAGVKYPWVMYASYYIPVIAWVGRYEWRFLVGDVVAGVTMASFYIPMALSLSANLAHLPPVHGLYAFAIQPLVYAMLGSCPAMVTGPEAAGSLLMGSVIRLVSSHHKPAFDDGNGEGDEEENARLAGVVTVMAGMFAFIAGFLRLGFLDSVLSRPLLRGFISGVGVVIFVDQLLPEMGLIALAKEQQMTHASTFYKFFWLIRNASSTHALTFAIAGSSFAIIMISREIKKHLQPRHSWVVFLPDRFLVVVLSAVLCSFLRWDLRGVEILGDVTTPGIPFQFFPPISLGHLNHAKEAMSTAFLIAVLGFFESVIAAKSLGTPLDMQISSNRELIALGTANMLGGCFQALPAFGGYGRSKVNKATGGRTPVSSVVLSACTIICILFLLPSFHFLPRSVLSAMISVVAVSLLEEAPADIIFFLRIRAWSDLATMALVFLTTLFWSLSTGIAVGVGISLIQVIAHSTRARIQILGRDPVTHEWKAIEDTPRELEQTPNLLVIKIRQSLTFANAGDLARRLWRIDRYGDLHTHPSMPRMKEGVRGVVFDVAGVGGIDGSGAQLLKEIVEMYVGRGVGVWFARVPGGEGGVVWQRMEKAGVIERVGGFEKCVESVDEALTAWELARGGA